MNTRKILSVILSLVMILTALPLTAVNSFAETSGDWIYHILDDGTAEIFNYRSSAYTGSETNVTIPSTIDGYTVTSIGRYAFYKCTSLTSVTIPNSVTSIGDSAFFECYSLASVSIPDSVTSIGYSAFEDCTSLTSVTIPDSVTSIEDYAFYGCTSLTSITIGNSVTSIGEGAFEDCTSLTSINVNEANENYCSVNGVLFNKDKTVLINYPRGKKDLSYKVPDGVEVIGECALQCCVFLTDVVLPDSVKTIKHHAFNSSYALKNISLPDSIECIECLAFNYTAYFQNKDNWEDGILYIGNHLITTDYWLEIEGEKEMYVETYPSDYVVKDGTVTIADYALSYDSYWWCFYYNEHLTSIVLPDSVKNVGYGVFAECIELKSVKLSNNLIKINDRAFFCCSSLEKIELPDSVTSIGSYAFADCSLTDIKISKVVEVIGEFAFGWAVAERAYPEKLINFTIYGYEGTEAERYANDNGFTFIALEKEPIIDPADLNGDGKITVVDAKWTLQAVAGSRTLTAEQITAADVNGDGKVTVVDAKWILQAVAGMRDLAK